MDSAVVLAAPGACAGKLEARKEAVAAVHRAEVPKHANEIAALEAHHIPDI